MNVTSLWARIPASYRTAAQHLAALFAATFAGSTIQDVVGAGGVTGVAWGTALVAALNAGAVAAATGVAAAWLAPVNHAYGLGARSHGAHEDTHGSVA